MQDICKCVHTHTHTLRGWYLVFMLILLETILIPHRLQSGSKAVNLTQLCWEGKQVQPQSRTICNQPVKLNKHGHHMPAIPLLEQFPQRICYAGAPGIRAGMFRAAWSEQQTNQQELLKEQQLDTLKESTEGRMELQNVRIPCARLQQGESRLRMSTRLFAVCEKENRGSEDPLHGRDSSTKERKCHLPYVEKVRGTENAVQGKLS